MVEGESDKHFGSTGLCEVDSIQQVEPSHPHLHLVLRTHIAHTNLQ